MEINNEYRSISISLAGGGIDITENGRISIGPNTPNQEKPRYDLGPATTANFNAIISYLERLKVHATDSE